MGKKYSLIIAILVISVLSCFSQVKNNIGVAIVNVPCSFQKTVKNSISTNYKCQTILEDDALMYNVDLADQTQALSGKSSSYKTTYINTLYSTVKSTAVNDGGYSIKESTIGGVRSLEYRQNSSMDGLSLVVYSLFIFHKNKMCIFNITTLNKDVANKIATFKRGITLL